jgi:peptidoglycan/LPS O-acetylase OafA/YrhL
VGVERLAFAQILRGVAALSVVYCHLIRIFFTQNWGPASLAAAPPLDFRTPHIVVWLSRLPFDTGHLGVGVFFLVSGFVIPFSLARYGAPRFLVARAVRIWPTYVAGFALTLVAIRISGWHWGRPFHHEPGAIVANALFVRDLLALPPVDAIVWTLEIEVRFYLLCALLRAPLLAGGAPVAIGVAAVCAVAAWFGAGLGSLQISLLMISFMFIGVLFHFHHRGRLATVPAALAVAVVFALFAAAWTQSGHLAPMWTAGVSNYGVALVVFTGGYALRRRIGSAGRLLGWLGDISYPLYVVHSIIGFAVMQVLVARFHSSIVAAAGGLAVVVPLAWFLHHFVEAPTMAWARQLAGRRARVTGE